MALGIYWIEAVVACDVLQSVVRESKRVEEAKSGKRRGVA